MRTLTEFVTTLLLLACLHYLTVALGIALFILVLMSAIVYTRRTLQLVAALGLLALTIKEPAVCAVTLGVVGAVGVIASQLGRRCANRPALRLRHGSALDE
jgi:hypothetical protein